MEISRTVDIAAPADRVWGLISDLPGMGDLSPENTGGSWQGGATGPAVGARFRGSNSQGRRSWSTAVTVVRCEPGEAFAFTVTAAGMKVAQWSYALTPTGAGCSVTETWTDLRGPLMKVIGRLASGVRDRETWTAESIERTLAALKDCAERPA